MTATPQRRAFWLRHLHRWHWVSASGCLIGMLLFAATGITLNHAGQIEASPRVTARQAELPAALQAQLAAPRQERAPLPAEVAAWIAERLEVRVAERTAEWSDDEVYVGLPRPGGDAWLSIDRTSGEVLYERTDRGWVSYLNDLHKGRHTGAAWAWYIDVLAAACLVFAATGLFILQQHAPGRPSTWPLVGFSALLPLLLAFLFIH